MRGEKQSRDIFLVITNKCNLSCRYCYEHKKDAVSLDVESARNILRKEFMQKERFSAAYVIFHGGEPFLEFERMRTIAEWVWEEYADLDVKFSVTTNGTMISDKAKEWLTSHRDQFVVVLSLDGTRKTHNYNRSNSYDKIDFDFFRTCYPAQPVKMTVGPETLANLFENYLAIRKMGLIPNPSLAKEVGWDQTRDVAILAQELVKMIRYFLDNPEVVPCGLINLPVEQIVLSNEDNARNCCGAGENIVAYDVNGHPFPCHAFINYLSPYDEKTIKQFFTALRTTCQFVAGDCKRCIIYSCCSPCYGLNYSNRGDIRNIDRNMCALNKIRVLASAKLKSQMLISPSRYRLTRDLSKEELADLARCIKIVFNNLIID